MSARFKVDALDLPEMIVTANGRLMGIDDFLSQFGYIDLLTAFDAQNFLDTTVSIIDELITDFSLANLLSYFEGIDFTPLHAIGDGYVDIADGKAYTIMYEDTSIVFTNQDAVSFVLTVEDKIPEAVIKMDDELFATVAWSDEYSSFVFRFVDETIPEAEVFALLDAINPVYIIDMLNKLKAILEQGILDLEDLLVV